MRGRDQGKGNGKVVVKTSKVDAFAATRPRPKSKESKPPKEENVITLRKLGIGRGIVLFIWKNWKRTGKCPF